MRSLFLVLLLFAAPLQAKTLVASIEPLAMLAREVLGEHVEVRTLLLPNQTPHATAFTPSQMQLLRGADLVLWLGADAEPYLAGLMAHRSGGAVALLDLPEVLTLAVSEEDGHGHDAAGLDPHLWLSPANMAALARALPAHAATLAVPRHELVRRTADFEAQLLEAQRAVRQRLRPVAQRPWLSYHDPWRYFYQSVGLSEPLVVSGTEEAGASSRHFAVLVKRMDERKVGCAIAEPEARRALMARLCGEETCRIAEADPLGRDQQGGGYTDFIVHLGELFADCLAAPAR